MFEKKVDKKDFVEGINTLRRESLAIKAYFDVANCKWIIPFSMYLSTRGLCYKFWRNVIWQGHIKDIPKCNTIDDICYGSGKCLFVWEQTPEGHNFWCDVLTKDIPKFSESTIITNLSDVCEIINKKVKM
jgi:hypothetical protein